MLAFLLSKLKQKKWLVCSLLIGNILLIAITVSHPLYKQAALDRMLADEFLTYISENRTNPGVLETDITRTKDTIDNFISLREKMMNEEDLLGVPLYDRIEYLREPAGIAMYEEKRDQKSEVNLQLSTITNLEKHAKIVSGSMFADTRNGDYYEGIVSETAFVELNLLVGDVITMKTVYDTNGEPVKVKVVGVFTADDVTDMYWVESSASYKQDIFISKNAFEEIHMTGDMKSIVLGRWFQVFDIENMRAAQVNALIDNTDKVNTMAKSLGGRCKTPEYLVVLESFNSKNNSVVNSLIILQVPVLVLLCAFLFMISGQMLSMEQTEISLLKSRGAARKHIFRIYFIQSVLMAGVSVIVAIPLGILLCQLLGSANAFLSFSSRKSLNITLGAEVWLYAALAVVVSILVQVIPAFKQSKLSIVSAKQKKHSSNKKWWQKIYLDFVMLLVSLYGFYTFTARKDELMLEVLAGNSLDPILYFSSSLFILGAGLVFLRFWPYIVRFVFALRKKSWKPEKYASFLQIFRTGHKQLFMMEFLILTVALGIFNATVARTILFNAEENETYKSGAELIVSQQWRSNYYQYAYGYADQLIYIEPDWTGFKNISGVNSVTPVLSGKAHKGTGVSAPSRMGKEYSALYFMGIVTNEFGPMVKDNEGNPYSLQDYLNVLSTNPNAVLVSENYRDKLGKRIGDRVEFTFQDKSADSWKKDFSGVIYGFFSEFPTYSPTTNSLLDDGSILETENFMIVGNLSGMLEQIGTVPYDLWFDIDSNGEKAVTEYINENNIVLTGYSSLDENIEKIHFDPLFQGTNGILTLSFIVILILCSVGFLIYWILSIKDRELLFGVFRAMGMSKNSILSMLINEQIFSTVIALIAGTGIGFVASAMFVPMIQMTYTAGNQVLVTPLVTWPSDMIRLFAVILIVFAVCMYVLAKIIFSMKITNALKLGED